MISLKKSYKFAIVALLVLIIAFFDYATALHLSKIDIVYRELYFIPILICIICIPFFQPLFF